jgi:hypothetical protein
LARLIVTKQTTLQERTGVWYYACKNLLEPYGFSPYNGRYQYRLRQWLKANNPGKIDGNDYFILSNGEVTIEEPADRCSVFRIIGELIEGRLGACEGIHYTDTECCLLREPKWEDEEGNELDKWVMGKPVYLSITCKTNRADEELRFTVYYENGELATGNIEEVEKKDGKYRARWEYKHNPNKEPDGEKPRFYFEARSKSGYKLQGCPLLEIRLQIRIIAVDLKQIIMVDDYPQTKGIIHLNFTKEQTIDGKTGTEFDVKVDNSGSYVQDDLLPCDVTVTVKTPIKRKHSATTYPADVNNPSTDDNIIKELVQLDGHEEIKKDNGLDVGKNNVIVLPVRFLERIVDIYDKIFLPDGTGPVSECDFVELMIGTTYKGRAINVDGLQYYEGVPTSKQLQELFSIYPVTIRDTSPAHNHAQQSKDFNDIISNQTIFDAVLHGSPGMSLPKAPRKYKMT